MEKTEIVNLKRPKYKTYIRFNKEENIFEEIILGIEHQERFEHHTLRYEKKISIGDLVKVWDGSGNLDFDSGRKRNGIDPLFKENPALVIETNLAFITEPLFGMGDESRYVLDLLLVFPSGERVYTSTTFIGVINDEEWQYYGTVWPKWEKIK